MAEVADQDISHMTLVDWLDDLTVRFLLNLPPSELSSVPRICFQVEEAQWFYEDFIRPANPTLPSLNLRQFLLTLFQHCPLLSGFDVAHHLAAYEEFMSYKTRVPVRGAILMDESMDKVLLVRGWKKGSSWSFPRGKINKDERDLDCAIREVYEETGYDATPLVESNEQHDGNVKAIDVTMREQHMKLFVFRGVSLDTHFEPKTRKEISKIQWYNVKDLPGFKKQKGLAAGQGQGDAQATKFYMVAPFLGQLKKFIGQQRKADAAALHARHVHSLSAADNGLQAGVTEDEADTEGELTTVTGPAPLDKSADELKKLLSIGSPVPTSPPEGRLRSQFQAQQAHQNNGTNNLLAMLKGDQAPVATGWMPQTPFDQIDPAIPMAEPQAPHHQHPRPNSIAQDRQAHQSIYSQQTVQQQNVQRIFSVPMQNMAAPTAALQSQLHPDIAKGPPHIRQQYLQQQGQQQRQHSLPNMTGPSDYSGQHTRAPSSSLNMFQQFQPAQGIYPAQQRAVQQPPAGVQALSGPAPHLASPMPGIEQTGRPSSSQMAYGSQQGTQKPIGSDQSAPEPSKLPAPKLNAHSLRLLDAFRAPSASKVVPHDVSAAGTNGKRPGSQQQAALLDLFRKPSEAQASIRPGIEDASDRRSTSPALTDVTEKPSQRKSKGRKPTLNEITRTLPPHTTPRSPSAQTPAVSPVQGQQFEIPKTPRGTEKSSTDSAGEKKRTSSPHIQQAPPLMNGEISRPKAHGQLFDPANPQKFVRAIPHTPNAEIEGPAALAATASRPKSRHASHSPKASPTVQSKYFATHRDQPTTQFSILPRPGSSAGKASKSPVQQSPLRREAQNPSFQPQVLKRPANGANNPNVPGKASEDPATGTIAATDDQKDHLLSLFGKAPRKTSTPGLGNPSENLDSRLNSTPTAPDVRSDKQRDGLPAAIDTRQPVVKTPEPPPSPRLLPDRKPSRQSQQPSGSQQNPQQLLLNLFNKPTSSALSSPGTPISPFTLGTPAAGDPPLIRHPLTGQGTEPRSRLGSVASAMSNGTGSPQPTSNNATPTAENKGFLLDYLNGVVQREGSRGAKR